MERTCEFCAALRPVVYCMPDAAHLCLSCDAKVHSANALSSRHLRTLLCDLCRTLPTYLQCLDHQMFLCRGCDRSLHVSSSQHQKRTIRGYLGCPSARDFAALWGFHINEVDNVIQDKFVSPCGSETASDTTFDTLGQACSHLTGGARISHPPHISGAEAENKGGSLTNETKVLFKGQGQSTSFIFQQILDLSRLQLIKNNHSPLILEGKDAVSSLRPRASEKFEQSLNQHLQHSEDRGTDLPQRDSLLQELKTTPFSQLENFPLSSAILLPFHGEPLWHCKSPAESNQLWSQNMQDLGVCDELVCGDDFNMPEVDLTFQNFEDMFDGDQDPIRGLLDSKDESYSSMEKDLSLDKSDNRHGKRMEASSIMSSSCIFRSARMDEDSDPSDQVCKPPTSTSTDSARPIQPSSSTLSFSDSRMSVGSAGSDWPDGAGGEPSCSSPCRREQKYSMSHNNAAMRGCKEKKQPQLQERQFRRKPRSLVKKRVKGRYEKVERYDSDAIAISRSY